MSGDGRIPTSKPWRLGHGRNFSKLLYVLLGLQTTFHLEYIDQDQQQKESDVNGIELPKMAVNPTDRETELSWERKDKFDLASLAFLDGDKIGILDIYSFDGAYADAKNTVRFTEFIDNAFKQLHDNRVESLVIDLRNNGGGEDEYGERLFSYFATEPYYYYDDLVINARKFSLDKYVPVESERREVATDKVRKRPDGKFSMIDHANLGLHQPRQPHFAGRVFILMNGGSFSTTAECLSVATYHKAAIFIGEEEGGAYFGNTSGWIVHVVLPNSGLVLNLRPLTYYLSVKGDHPPDRGVMPDYHVSYSIHDWLAGKDKEMELALKLARSGLGTAPTAGR
jgi:C-terminal processing protease CtpA/Prc